MGAWYYSSLSEYFADIDIQEFVELPSPDDWKRFNRNASRVRRLDLAKGRLGFPLSMNLLNQLSRTRPHTYIFPFLRHLRASILMLDSTFLPIDLTELDLEINLLDTAANLSLLRSSLRSVIAYAPLIRTLRVNNQRHYAPFAEEFIPVIAGLPRLETLILPAQILSTGMVNALANAPHLSCLTFEPDPHDAFRMGSVGDVVEVKGKSIELPTGAFPSLRELGMCTLSSSDAFHFLLHPQLSASSLRSLTVQFAYSHGPIEVNLRPVLEMLNVACPRLDHLAIRFVELAYNDNGFRWDGTPEIKFSDVSLFLEMAALSSFSLEHPSRLVIVEKDIETIAERGARFKNISLVSSPRWSGRSSLLPLQCLIPLARSCRRLERLDLCLSHQMPDTAPLPTVRFEALRELVVGESRIGRGVEDERTHSGLLATARFLASILPQNCAVSSSPSRRIGRSTSFGQAQNWWLFDRGVSTAKGWRVVIGMVRVIREERDCMEIRVRELRLSLQSLMAT